MDNYSGIFGDGDLGNLDLGGESFSASQNTTPSSEMELGSFPQQPYAGPAGSNAQGNTASIPSGPAAVPPQKMTMGPVQHTQQPNPQNIGNYPNQPSYQYNPPQQQQQQPIGQYQTSQYQSPYPGQEMYAQNSPMQPNQNMPQWRSSPDTYTQVSVNYPQGAYSVANSQPPINSFPTQTMNTAPVNSMQATVPTNYKGISQQSINQGYVAQAPGIPFQNSPRQPFPGYDPQRPMASNSPTLSSYTGATSAGPQGQPQQYTIIQSPRQPYHMPPYASQGQVSMPQSPHSTMGQQQPPPPQQQILGAQCPQGDLSQYPNSQMPNGTAVYRAPFPQVSPQLSPHPQASPRPQLSPMPRSMSPHTHSNLAMTSPVSSPASIPPSSGSPNPNAPPGPAIQQLEGVVKPSNAGRNTPNNPSPCTTQQPLQSPVVYNNNSSVHSPLGPRAPMSPGITNRPMTNPMSPNMMQNRPVSPQQWQQTRSMSHQSYIQPGGYSPVVINSQRASVPNIPHGLPPGQVLSHDTVSSDSISSVSETSLNSNESAIAISNGPVSVNLNNSAESNINCVEVQASSDSKINTTFVTINGAMPSTINIPRQSVVSPSVPHSAISSSEISAAVTSSVSQLSTLSGNVPLNTITHPDSVSSTTIGTEKDGSLNKLPIAGPVIRAQHISSNNIPGSPLPSVSTVGNTMVRFTTSQVSSAPYSSQGYRIAGPRVFVPQGQMIQGSVPRPLSNQLISAPSHSNVNVIGPPSLASNSKFLPMNQNQPVNSQTIVPAEGSNSSLPQPSDSNIEKEFESHCESKPDTSDAGATSLVAQMGGIEGKIESSVSQSTAVPRQPQSGNSGLVSSSSNVMANGPAQIHANVSNMGPVLHGNMAQTIPGTMPSNVQGVNQPKAIGQMSVPHMNSMPAGAQMPQHRPQMVSGSLAGFPRGAHPNVVSTEPIQVGILPSGQINSTMPGMAPQRPPPGPPGMRLGRPPGPTQGSIITRNIAPQMQQVAPQAAAPRATRLPGQGQPLQPQLNLSIDIQQVQKQIQQLYKLPQTIQTQQKINELQQKLSHLQQQQQQQQQHFLQNQSLYQSQPPPAPQQQPANEGGGAVEGAGKGKKKTPTKKQPKEVKAKSPKTPKPKKEVKPKEPKVKKPKVPKSPKTPKEPRPKKEKVPKPPKETKPKVPKEKKTPAPKKGKKKAPVPIAPAVGPDAEAPPTDTSTGVTLPSSLLDISVETDPTSLNFNNVNPVTGEPLPVLPTTATKPKSEKKGKLKSTTPGKKKPAARLGLNFKKGKKKRRGSESDFSDAEGSLTSSAKDEDEANKRRSGRHQGSRKKYIDELDLNLSEEDDTDKNADGTAADDAVDGQKPNFIFVDPNSEDTMPVQMILVLRLGEREVLSESEDEVENAVEGLQKKEKEKRKVEVEEFYVKYKAFSHLHCEWRTEEELLKGDKRIQGKIKRFKQKRAASENVMDFLEEEAFNPDYIEIDRLLDLTETVDPHSGKTVKHYLVKWKSLPYEDATWEVEEDVDAFKIEQFLQYRDVPPKSELKYKKRPKSDDWDKLTESPVYKNNNMLRPYQLEGLNWLNFSYNNGHNCILADEMGLGKTIQSLAFIESIYKYGIRGPFLIIAPLSTIPNWQREFEGWTDLNIIVYHGSQASRNIIMEYEMYYKDDKGERIPNIYKFNVLITTFEVIISDSMELKEICWRCCIIDEAHRLKNRNCKLLEGLRMMNLEHRVLLSGTPLQNNVNELFSLLNFLEPSQFSCQEEFLQEFGKLESEEQVKKLQALLKPMMLRRMKEDVEKSLAPKEETIIEVELTNIQKKYYRAILERNFDFLVKGATYTNVPSLMNTMMELRKCCLHPYLLNGAEDAIQLDYKETHPDLAVKGDVYHNALIQSSGKMVLVDKLLPRLRENGHRVLIFSQMVKLLDILEDYLIYRKYPYERIDGRIRGNLRQAAIDRYCKPESDRFVFLLCTKAGGLGINLTAADTVIIYDSDWNPQNDLQAQARCHRIGQLKCVKIYRLLCRSTYEREMFDKASLKLGLDKAVLQSMNTKVKNAAGGNSLGLSKKDIEDLLKKGAYGALMEDDNQGDKFCEEDIDQIMSRRTQVIQLESEKGSTFSKASFSASSNRTDIDLDDPDFWKKWAKRCDIDVEEGDNMNKKQLIVTEPRRRSQIRRYGHDESIVDCSDLESSGSDTDKDPEQSEDLNGDPRMRTRGRRRGRSGRRSNRPSRYRTSRQDEEDADSTGEVRYGFWARPDCFKVEKGLLTFGWGRWKEILQQGEFKSTWKETDVQDCGRMILLFCIRYYRGDDKIKGFIFDLIAPTTDGKTKVHHNHIGLSAPVPRGRKGKKKLREAKLIASHMEGADWAKDEKYDTEIFLDQGYSRHLTRHANKVLLRVRLLFYIKQEIIGELATQIDEGARSSDLPIHPPPTELPPKPWWDVDGDRGVLVGVYKHGYERYNVIRNDPCLPFLSKCGPPDKAALLAEMISNVNEDELDKEEKEEDSDSNQTPSSPAVAAPPNAIEDELKCSERTYLPFPSASDINGRLRRLVTSYQRNNKKMEMRKEANVRGFDHYLADKLMRRERMAEYIRERELRKADYNQRRWSNREQAEFYRTISTFGVEYIRKEKRYDWNKFRMLSRLEKRLDENLTEYFRAFMAMCKRQCGIRLSEQENSKIMEVGVDRLPEERARRVLERVDLLNRLRNDVLPHADLPKVLELALPSRDLPDWWIPAKHDLDLIKGVARHGLGRTDYYILYDPDLCFREILRRHTAGEPLITKNEKEELHKKYYTSEKEEEEEEKMDVDEAKPEDKSEDNEKKEDESIMSESKEDSKEEETPDTGDCETEKADNVAEQPSDGTDVEDKPKLENENVSEGDEKPCVNSEKDEKPDIKLKTESEADLSDEEESKPIKKEIIETKEEIKDENEQKPTLEVKKEEPPPAIKDEHHEVKSVASILREIKTTSSELREVKSASSSPHVTATPLFSLQQMDEAMAKFDTGLNIDSLAANEPTVAQLLAQSAANPIKWPKDRILQIRLDHIMHAVEHKKWPVSMDFQSADFDCNGHPSKCDTPPSNPSTPNPQEMLLLEAERKRRRQLEEVERAHLQAMLHPNLHHNLGLSKVTHTSAAAAAAAALGLNPSSFSSFLENADHEKKSHASDSHSNALRQLQALQGSLDLTIKPVSSSQSMDLQAGYLHRRGPGRPRLDDQLLRAAADKRRMCESPQEKNQDRKRRKLDDIVLGLSSKGKGDTHEGSSKESSTSTSLLKDANPLALLKGSSVTLLSNKDKLTSSVNTPKLSSSISITPTSLLKQQVSDSKSDGSSSQKSNQNSDKESGSSKPGLIKSIDLPPGINLPPGIELYRPSDSAKVDKWLEQHQGLLGESRSPKRRKVDISSFDWSQFNGDEHVTVINTNNGQKLSGDDAPKLKHLAQWLIEHPAYDVDPQWAENSKDRSSDLHRRLGVDKKISTRAVLQSPLSFGIAASTSSTIPLSSPSPNSCTTTMAPHGTGKSSSDHRNLLQGLDPKNSLSVAALAGLDPKFLAGLDPKLLSSILDPKALGFDPKLLFGGSNIDPKLLYSALGIDSKLLGLDTSKLQEPKAERKPSPAPSPKSSDPKPSTSHGIDPKLLAGIDPKLLAGIDPKILQSIDPKLLGFDPKLLTTASIDPKSLGLDAKAFSGLEPKLLGGIDPKLLGIDPKLFMTGLDPKLLSGLGVGLDPKTLGNLDPKLLASMGMDPMMMMAAGFGGLPGMAGLGLTNPLLAGLPGFALPGMPNVGASSSKSKDNQRNAAAAAAAAAVAASQANLFSGMFGGAGAAGLMYPPLGLGGLGAGFPMSSVSSALLNGLAPTVTSTAGSSKQTSSSSSKRQDSFKQRTQEALEQREKEMAARKERLKETSKTSSGGLSREERHLLKQKKAERLARGGSESKGNDSPQLDLTPNRTTPTPTSSVQGGEKTPDIPENTDESAKEQQEEDPLGET